MRKNKSLSEPLDDWVKFVNFRIEVFCKALDLLQVTEEMKKNEIDVSDSLFPKLKIICFSYKKKNPGLPKFDSKIGATTEDELDDESINKKPDFTYSMVNSFAETIEDSEINLHIECKRIGNNDPSWNLNMNYITDGINRFDYLSHKYGKDANDGIMIGYIIDSTKSDIQEEINQHLPENIERLNFMTKNKVENITTKFERKNVEPFDFKLHHIWADFTVVD